MRDHLLLRGFMDGYRWHGDEDDYEVVHGGRPARNEEGQQDNRGEGGREDEESLLESVFIVGSSSETSGELTSMSWLIRQARRVC